MDLNDYKIKEIVVDHDDQYKEVIEYLSSILNDKTIPEENKSIYRKQWNEIMRLKSITMSPPKIILEKIK